MWSSVSSLSYCPNSCLLDNHFLTHTLLCILLRGGAAFCSFSASFSLFFCSSTTARAAARYRHLLFSATTVSLAFSMLPLPQAIQQWLEGWSTHFYMACQSRHDGVWIAQTGRANAWSVWTVRILCVSTSCQFCTHSLTISEHCVKLSRTLRQPPSACHQRARFTTTKFVAMRTHKSCKCQPRLTQHVLTDGGQSKTDLRHLRMCCVRTRSKREASSQNLTLKTSHMLNIPYSFLNGFELISKMTCGASQSAEICRSAEKSHVWHCM